MPKKEFRVMAVKIQSCKRRTEEKIQEMLNKKLEDEQIELNITITEVKNTLEGISRRKNEAGEQKTELADRSVEITAVEQKEGKACINIPRSLCSSFFVSCDSLYFKAFFV